MCGICGFVGSVPDPGEVLRRMTATLEHRGPDDKGSYLADEVGLGVRRLSIIDLAGGHQPMESEDGTVQVVFNGEIYNHGEVRAHLEKLGHRFRSRSDTEVLVHVYEEYGEHGVHLLRGMYAYAVWDARRRRLVLFRDRLGIKPLYYAHAGDSLVFASEIKAILEHPSIAAEVDVQSLDSYLTFQYVPGPQTMFRGIHKLQPAHILRFDDRQLTIRRYWDVVFNDCVAQADLGEASEEFAALFKESVRLHTVSDVPVGALLSGGIDSSAVVAGMSSGEPGVVRTFSVGFDIAGVYNEQPDARRVARHFQTQHREVTVTADAAELLPTLAWHLDEPIADPAVLPTYLLCRAAQHTVPVVLTGEGGDELLAGYPRYGWFLMAKRFQRTIPASVRQAALAITANLPALPSRYRKGIDNVLAERSDIERHLCWIENFDARTKGQLLSSGVHRHRVGELEALAPYFDGRNKDAGHMTHRLMALDLHMWLVDDILTKMDKMSMAASVEARVPFLDHCLVEFLAAKPVSLKIETFGTKRLLRRAMRGLLPRETLARRKHAFLVPVDQWLRGSLRTFLHDVVLSQRSRERGWFRTAHIEALISEHRRGKPHGQRLWNLLCLELWARAFLDRHRHDAHLAPHVGLSAG